MTEDARPLDRAERKHLMRQSAGILDLYPWPPQFWTVSTRLAYRGIKGRVNRPAIHQYFIYWFRQRMGCEPTRKVPRTRWEAIGAQSVLCPHAQIDILDDAIDYVLLHGWGPDEEVPVILD